MKIELFLSRFQSVLYRMIGITGVICTGDICEQVFHESLKVSTGRLYPYFL